jgi:hypothetical protein
MKKLKLIAGPFTFRGRFEEQNAPKTVAAFVRQISGNHFATLTDGLENLHPLGRKTLLEGAQDIRFEIG